MNRKFVLNRRILLRLIVTAILLALAISMLLPLIWMISASLKFESDVFNFPIDWIPKRFNAINNYKEVLSSKYNFVLYYWNSIKVAVFATFLQVTFSAMGAYAFTKINFPFKNGLFMLYLITLMIPEQVTIVPRFMVFKYLNLYNTHLGLIVMLSFSVYGVFLLRQFMVTIPLSLSEAAKIDGAGHFTIFMRIILPMTKPAIATLGILKFVWTWNDYQNPLVFLYSEELYTLQLGMRQFATESGVFYSLVMTSAVLAIAPLFIMFIIGQKYVIEGISMGAVKG